MADTIPLKIYTNKDTSLTPTYNFLPDLSRGDSNYSADQLREVTADEFLGVINQNKSYYDNLYNSNTTPGIKEAYQSVLNGTYNPVTNSPYVADPTSGVLSTQATVDSDAANKAAVAAGTMKEISPGVYIPIGSAGDLALQGKTQAEQLATPSVQQQVQQQGLTPASPAQGSVPGQPGQPAPAAQPTEPRQTQAAVVPGSVQTAQLPAQGVQMPSVQDTLAQIYASRPDLQQLYNPDGSAKSPTDPRIAGIPTLQDWAKTYGVNESPQLKTALESEQTQTKATDEAVKTATGQGSTDQKTAINKLLSDYGVDPNLLDTAQDPVKYVQDTYAKVYGSLGVASAKQQYDDYNKQLLDLRNKKTDDISKINDNPWYTEGKRVLEIGKLDDKYAQKEANLIGFMQLSQSIYQDGLQQAQFVTGQAIQLHQDQTQFAEQLVTQAIQSSQAKADARYKVANGSPFYKFKGSDLVFSTETGHPVDFDTYKSLGGVGEMGSAFGDVFEILDTNSQIEQSAVLDLMSKYGDAGIRPSDSLSTAQSKLGNSRIYADQVRPPSTGGGGGGGGILGLSNQQIDNISPLVTQFQNSDIVKNYNTIGEGYNFVRSLSSSTTNPADDQALVYALAKALDPGSVVREGEYATVQKYAQSLVNSYGKSVTQALSGTGFLSTTARNNIKSTIESRFLAAERSYNNLYAETERRVNLVGNTDKGSLLLNNYGGAFAPQTSSSPGFVGPVNPSAQTQPTNQSNGGILNNVWSGLSNFFGGG